MFGQGLHGWQVFHFEIPWSHATVANGFVVKLFKEMLENIIYPNPG